MAPRLETERLILRGHRVEDFPVHASMWRDPRTLAHTQGLPRNDEELWLRFLRNEGQWQMMGVGMWALEEKASSRYAGSIGFIYAKRMMDIPFRDEPEMGWVIAPDFHGRGFAREAVVKIAAWGDANLDAAQSWCMIKPVNQASLKVAAAAGFQEAGRAPYKDEEMILFTRPRCF